MQPTLRTTCACGWETTGLEDDVVAATLDHGLRVHNMGGTREVVLERGHVANGALTEAQLDEALDVLRMTRP